MLVLTRRLGETINIGESIKVKVVDIKGKKIKLDIRAPSDVHITRPNMKKC